MCKLKFECSSVFTFSPLFFDRAKSKSSPHLDEEERSQWQGLFTSFFPPFLHRSHKSAANASGRAAAVAHGQYVGFNPRVGAYARSRSLSRRLLQEQVRSTRDYWPRNERAAAELERERRNIISAMRSREPERGGPRPPRGKKTPAAESSPVQPI